MFVTFIHLPESDKSLLLLSESESEMWLVLAVPLNSVSFCISLPQDKRFEAPSTVGEGGKLPSSEEKLPQNFSGMMSYKLYEISKVICGDNGQRVSRLEQTVAHK